MKGSDSNTWMNLVSSLAKLRQRFPGGDTWSSGTVTWDDVVWGYRLFLDRNPENEHVILQKTIGLGTTRDLRADLMSSSEFFQNNPDLAYMNERNIVIKEISDQLRLFVDLSDYVIGLGIIRGDYEQSEIDFVRQTVKPGWTVLDIGANIGLYSIIMAELVGPTGKVYAFEPLERTAELLERSVAENHFQDRIELERAAVGARAGSSRLVSPKQTLNWGGAFLLEGEAKAPDGHTVQPVETITLDTYALDRPVHFIKIDIEGAEPLAIRGAKQVLQEDRPIILSELHPGQLKQVGGCTPTELISEMDTYGYECHDLEKESWTKKAKRAIAGEHSAGIRSVVFVPKHGW